MKVLVAFRGAKDAVEPRPIDADGGRGLGAECPVEQLSNGDGVHRPEFKRPATGFHPLQTRTEGSGSGRCVDVRLRPKAVLLGKCLRFLFVRGRARLPAPHAERHGRKPRSSPRPRRRKARPGGANADQSLIECAKTQAKEKRPDHRRQRSETAVRALQSAACSLDATRAVIRSLDARPEQRRRTASRPGSRP